MEIGNQFKSYLKRVKPLENMSWFDVYSDDERTQNTDKF